MSSIAQRRKILRKIPYGLYIITSRLAGNPVATVVSFVTQTALDPPLLIVALRDQSIIYQAVEQHGYFGLHFIDRDRQQMIADFFKTENYNDQEINGYRYVNSDNNLPLLADSPMIIEAQVQEIIKVGDHRPIIGKVLTTHLRRDIEILKMEHTNWHYGG
ncbi:MAG: flavin reductase [Candidatus Marinimicrobia bacterium]|nr:flavin reductase [Candidatus Neomarinimicrobiota bacterium]